MGTAVWQRRVVATTVLASLAIPSGAALAQQVSPAPAPAGFRVVGGGALEMKVRRTADAVDLVIEGVGTAPQLQQTTRGATWEGRLLTTSPASLRYGPQRLALPEAGFQSLSLEGAGTLFRLQVTPVPGYPVPRPVVSADGRNLILTFTAPAQASLQTANPNLNTPGRVVQPAYVPPLQPRAVAPPVGDMAVGTMTLGNASYINVSGPPVTMTLRNAPAKDVLMALAQLGGYGFTFVQDFSEKGPKDPDKRPISIAFRNESYGRALNSALLASGLQGKRDGNTIYAGTNVLGKSFGPQMSKVYRLNQASATSAANYLANLGATINKTFTTTSTTSDIQSAGTGAVGTSTQTSQFATTTQIDSYGAAEGPLKGLTGTTDSRLGTITLVGDPRLVGIAEAYLRQLDLRQRQVALSVKILDVTLNNDKTVDNSFAFRYGNNFIVNDRGQLLGAFGRNLPATSDDFGYSLANPGQTNRESGSSSSSSSRSTTFTINDNGSLSRSDLNTITGLFDQQQITTSTSTTPTSTAITVTQGLTQDRVQQLESLIERTTGLSVTASTTRNQDSASSYDYRGRTQRNPGLMYPRDNFFDFVKAQIESRTTKILASPTLILSENSEELRKGEDKAAVNIQNLSTGSSTSSSSSSSSSGEADATIGRTRANESYVTVGEQVITNFTVNTDQNGNVTCQPEFGISGLTFGARVAKIDDNGFVTFSLSPAISATVRQQQILGCGPVDILAVRRLDTGSARVRDGQTLILTGVISDSDNQVVTKWPILGDLPILGQFFRASGSDRAKRELVILVTPRIIDDNEGGTFGYGYQPSTPQSREFMGNGGQFR